MGKQGFGFWIETWASDPPSASRRLELSTFGFTGRPQLITALSEGRGYGEAGGEGLFASLGWLVLVAGHSPLVTVLLFPVSNSQQGESHATTQPT